MRAWLIAIAFLLLATGATGQLAPYWVPDAGCQKHYEQDLTVPWLVEARAPLTLHFEIFADMYWESRRYEFDDEQDVCWEHTDWYQSSHGWDVETDWFTPPVKVVDYPLTTGKTWQSTSLWHTTTHSIARNCVVTGTVIGPRVVETGLGPLDVIEITLHYDFAGGPPDYTTTYYLHEQLGDVRNMVATDGCGLVPAEATTWSKVKAMYR